MRLGLTQSLRTEQRLVQSPQMIQAMQVLQLPLLELKDHVEQEPQENVFLERRDEADRGDGAPATAEQVPTIEDRLQREEDVADILVDLTTTVAASRLAVAKLGLEARTE